MYGFVAEALVEWLQTRDNADEEIAKILELAAERGVDTDITFNTAQPDDETLICVAVSAEVTGLTVEEVLFQTGLYQLPPLIRKGYLPLAQSLGDDFFMLCRNLDTMHMNFANVYPSMSGPSINAFRNEDNTILMQYFSSRDGIRPYLWGLLTAVASALFDLQLEFTTIKRREDVGYDEFTIKTDNIERTFGTRIKTQATYSSNNGNLNLSPDTLDALFPWHLSFDRDFKITSIGSNLAKRFAKSCVGDSLDDIARVVRPYTIKFEFDKKSEWDGSQMVFAVVRDDAASDEPVSMKCPVTGRTYELTGAAAERYRRVGVANLKGHLFLKGEVRYEQEMDVMVFVGTPHLSNLEELKTYDIDLVELPVHSNARDMVFAQQHSSATIGMAKELEVLTRELEVERENVNREKMRIHELLYSILPPTIADSLQKGIMPGAERYENVSLLFSDIVGFTNISSNVSPTDVMAMLNELFSKFDVLCEKHNVFKVETIGDAYMVASGLPVANPRHADNLAGFAVDMVAAAATVLSPMDGEALRIRVGLHSGVCMAGVVGMKRPRYCLFGDTVNVSSRMESTGVPGAVQCSYAFLKSLHKRSEWNYLTRGRIAVKGKGEMKTFFLLGRENGDVQLEAPDVEVLKASGPSTPALDLHRDLQRTVSPMPGAQAMYDPRFALSTGPSLSQLPSSMALGSDVPRNVRRADASMEEEEYFTVEIDMDGQALTVPFASGFATLSEVMADVLEDAQQASKYRFFTDAAYSKMLLSSMTLRQIQSAMATTGRIKRTSRVLELYLGPVPVKDTSPKVVSHSTTMQAGPEFATATPDLSSLRIGGEPKVDVWSFVHSHILSVMPTSQKKGASSSSL